MTILYAASGPVRFQSAHATLAQLDAFSDASGLTVILVLVVLAILFSVALVFVQRYKKCPPNRVMVVYGKAGGDQKAKLVHSGATFVWPVIQDYTYLSLEPITIDIDLAAALSKKNIRVAVPSTFTIAVSTEAAVMNNAAERLLGLNEKEIAANARDIILGQMRLVIAMLTIEEINQDRERFLDLVNKNVNFELNKIGLEMINVNIRDITDESGYIDALGQKAAAEAINQALIDRARAEREGAIGTSSAQREREIAVATEHSASLIGQKQAERDQRIRVAEFEAQGLTGEATSRRAQDVAVAEQAALSVQGKKQAEAEQRRQVATYEAQAVEGENQSKAQIADYEATLDERQADAKRRGDVALANARRDVLLAEKEQELARMQKEVIAKQMIERQQVEIDADADAERARRVARGEADATLAKYEAEAEGLQKVLAGKAAGYHALMQACGDRKELAASLLIIEQLPQLVAEQVKAIRDLKIDKITVWDSGMGGGGGGVNGDGNAVPSDGSTARFLRSLIGSLPPIHELARQAGIDLPRVLGTIEGETDADDRPTAP